MAQRSIAQRGILTALALIGLAGCTSVGNLLEGDKINYKSAGKAPTLEVPPDLTQLQRDNRYAIPESNRGTATASGFNLEQGTRPANASTPAVIAPSAIADMKIERDGSQRWLVGIPHRISKSFGRRSSSMPRPGWRIKRSPPGWICLDKW